MRNFEAHYEKYQYIPRVRGEVMISVSGETPKAVLRAAKEYELKPYTAKRGAYAGRRLIKICLGGKTIWESGRWLKDSESYKEAFSN